MGSGVSKNIAQTRSVLFERRWVFSTWLALMAGCAVGGWFFGRASFLPTRAFKQETHAKHSRKADSVFTANSSKGQWTEQVKNAAPTDFPRLLEKWRNLFPESDDGLAGQPEHALRWLFAQWLVHDRESFIAIVSAKGFDESYWAAKTIVQMNPQLAAELLRNCETKPLHHFFTDSLASELASQQPGLYLSLNPDGLTKFTHEPYSDSGRDDWKFALKNLAKTDPLAAANFWRKQTRGNDLDGLLPVFQAWREGDPPLKDWVVQIEDPAMRNVAQHARLIALAQKDAHAALAELYSTRITVSNDIRTNAPREILAQLAKKDLPAALKLLKETSPLFALPTSRTNDPFADPPAETPAPEPVSSGPLPNPFVAAGSSSDTPEDNWVRNIILREAAANLPKDPDKMLAALRNLRSETGWLGPIEAQLIRNACQNLPVDSCLATAKLWAAELNGVSDDSTFQSLAARAAAIDPDKVEAALDSLPEVARASFAAEIVKKLPQEERKRRLGLLDQLSPTQWDEKLGSSLGEHPTDYADAIAALPSSTTGGARGAFLEIWTQQDPAAASRWFASLPQDKASGPAAQGLFKGWADYDKSAAIAWAESLPAGPARKAIALEVVRALGGRSAADAWRWAATITDPQTRAWAYNTVSVTHSDAPEAFKKEHAAALLAAGMK